MNISGNICFGYLLDYPKYMFCQEIIIIKTRSFLHIILLIKAKSFDGASLGTGAVVVTRFYLILQSITQTSPLVLGMIPKTYSCIITFI